MGGMKQENSREASNLRARLHREYLGPCLECSYRKENQKPVTHCGQNRNGFRTQCSKSNSPREPKQAAARFSNDQHSTAKGCACKRCFLRSAIDQQAGSVGNLLHLPKQAATSKMHNAILRETSMTVLFGPESCSLAARTTELCKPTTLGPDDLEAAKAHTGRSCPSTDMPAALRSDSQIRT